ALGLNSTDLLLALLVTQFVAFPSALTMGRLSRKLPSERLITVCITAYFCIACFAFFLAHAWQFWVLAICVGMFQGGIQALSRSHFTKIIPPERSGEYFGFMDICGKGAAFLGTILMSFVSQVTGRISFGIIPIALFFLLGLVLFRLSIAKDRA
ncbi:MAG: MFS transporter, partial [Lachnospiraceae bacterium]|nr:MFS transporter [Lachnospiraceae bacterium]